MYNVIPLSKYCEMEGTSKDAIKKRIRNGVWRMGQEVIRLRGISELQVDLEAVDRWKRNPTNQC